MKLKFSSVLAALSFGSASSFTVNGRRNRALSVVFAAPPSTDAMRVGDIKAELKGMGVSYSDCFDRESLVARLNDAREGKVETSVGVETADETANSEAKATSSPPASNLDEESVLLDLRSKTLKELKIECSQRSLRYATFLEKEDFVQAIWRDMQAVASFSVSGALRPGRASEITGTQLDEEIGSDSTPILVDVYATWCGPCKLMAPELEKVAEELGAKCRVAKLDSDQNPEWSSRYQVQGLPTTLLIKNGKVQGRLEGAVMKDNLLELAQPFL